MSVIPFNRPARAPVPAQVSEQPQIEPAETLPAPAPATPVAEPDLFSPKSADEEDK